jgi:hypothetical protein
MFHRILCSRVATLLRPADEVRKCSSLPCRVVARAARHFLKRQISSSDYVSIWLKGGGGRRGYRRECTAIVARARDARRMEWSANNTAGSFSFSCLLCRVWVCLKALWWVSKSFGVSLYLFETASASRCTNSSVKRTAVQRYDCAILVRLPSLQGILFMPIFLSNFICCN